MADTKIEWAKKVWNPTTGCTHASAGCDHCYAVRLTKRLAAMGQGKYQGLINPGKEHFNGVVNTWDDELTKPLRWKKPTQIFVNSMSDLFHKGVPFEFVDKVFAVMALCPQHTFMVLTKRADRMEEYITQADTEQLHWLGRYKILGLSHFGERVTWPLPNVLLGISVENQKAADERHHHLARLHDQGWTTFWSAEPLIGEVSISQACRSRDLFGSEGLSWVICGGESGMGARPMHPEWARSLRDQCQSYGISYFFKQWGSWRCPQEGEFYDTSKGRSGRPPAFLVADNGEYGCYRETSGPNSVPMIQVGKHRAGRLLDGREWNELPEVRSGA